MYMKKFYSISAILMLSMLFSSTSIAQFGPECPPGATAFGLANIPTATIPCQIFIQGALPNAVIKILDDGDTDITIQIPGSNGRTDANGNAVIGYVCERFSTSKYVTLTQDNGNTCDLEFSSNIALPIKLSDFNATLSDAGAKLSWGSIFEANSSHFGVEKSNDGKNFSTIATVKAAGNSSSPLKYSFVDKNFPGTAYYRLKLVDLDGRNEYSKTIYVNGGPNANTTFSVFPNPFRSDVQLKGINASDVNKNTIRVFTVTGQEVNFSVTGSNSISIDPTLPQGVYILRVKDQSYKLFKN